MAALRASSRELGTEGVMLKRLQSPYGVGRQRGDWWKSKIEPYSVDAVLLNAQRGHGRRASLYTAYTFGVWDGDKLVPFAKAYSGLTDVEIRAADSFIRRNTVERFGPVCRHPRTRLRNRVRRHSAVAAAQVRDRRAVPPHGPLAHR